MKKIVFMLLLLIVNLSYTFGQVKLANLFTDNMVLQANEKVKIWGKALPKKHITISFNGQTHKVQSDRDGKWLVTLDPMKYGGPYQMVVEEEKKEKTLIDNVMIGEVWLCSGQSNMEMRVNSPGYKVVNYEEEVKNADFPMIRAFNAARNISLTAEDELQGRWEVTTPDAVSMYSAVAYFFARELYNELGVAIGIINSSWGGTDIETWISQPTFDKHLEKYKARYKDKDLAKVLAPNDYYSTLYNGMIAPIIDYTIKGVIWYQGENNTNNADAYHILFSNLIKDWRKQFGYDFSFYWVQLANYKQKDKLPTQSKWAELREAQTQTLSLPKTGQTLAIDIGDADDIHPKNKQEVGRRLALHALSIDYQIDNVLCHHPIVKDVRVVDNQIEISFDHIGAGLQVKNKYGYIEGFALAGEDQEYKWAQANLSGDKVIIHYNDIEKPQYIQYGWSDNPDINLFSKEGLPATPFRWEMK